MGYASDGHAPPLLAHRDGRCDLLPGTGGRALGLPTAFECCNPTVSLKDGDTLRLYTDGVAEAMNAAGEQFGNERMKKVFEDLEGGPADNPNERVSRRYTGPRARHPSRTTSRVGATTHQSTTDRVIAPAELIV